MENFLELLKKRRSCRRFTDEPVSEEAVANIMRAALMSPSGHRVNPWEFVLVEDKEMLKALSVSKAAGAQLIEGAAMAVVVIADTTKTDVWIEDCSIATILMQLAAEEMGLGSCWVQIRLRNDAEGNLADTNVKSLLNIPGHYAVLSILAVGHKEKEGRPFDEEKLEWEKIHVGKYGKQKQCSSYRGRQSCDLFGSGSCKGWLRSCGCVEPHR
jgi:nitroreductase